MTYPRHQDRAPESDLAGYLAEAERLAARADQGEASDHACVSEDFDALRWFDLPAQCLRRR